MQREQYSPAAVGEIIEDCRHLAGACLPILHRIQDRFGYIPSEAVFQVATALNLSRAEVHGVVTFYKDFRTTPGGRHVVRICRAESCQAVGGDDLADGVRQRLGIDFGETTPDGAVSLEAVFCLGNCALSPAAMVDETLVGRADGSRVEAVLDNLREAL